MVLVSDRFHMFRSLVMAEDLGLEAHGSPVTTSPIEDSPVARLYHTLREVAAYTAYVLASSVSVAEGKLDLTKVLWSSLPPDLEAIQREAT